MLMEVAGLEVLLDTYIRPLEVISLMPLRAKMIDIGYMKPCLAQLQQSRYRYHHEANRMRLRWRIVFDKHLTTAKDIPWYVPGLD